MILTALVGVLFATSTLAPQDVPADHPVRLDRTGIAWAIPFDAARSKAQDAHRLKAQRGDGRDRAPGHRRPR